MDNSNVYLRANGQMLQNFRGQKVCLLGKLSKTASDCQSFEIKTCDNKTVQCKLKAPVREALSDLVEVYGEVTSECDIHCLDYAVFEPDQINNFDMDLYNETVQMIYQLPKHYVQSNC